MMDADSVVRLRAKFPNIPPEPLMAQAYLDCLQWALGFDPILSEFRDATGTNWSPGQTPIDRMIDNATGAPTKFIETFIPWFDTNVWGDEDLGAVARGEVDGKG